ncbi:MAG: virulence RhuM family protein [Bacteroidota bacterium]|nr:virulence RhuM family protein [Bacteroidota bacterium]
MESEIVIYKTKNGDTKIDVRLENKNVWLSQSQMAILYQTSVSNISKHLTKIFKEKELEENTVIDFFSTTASDGKFYSTQYYNLDAIISIGYRVKSTIATQFRIWATKHLAEYLKKGFIINDEKLKHGEEADHFSELVERIRDIRSSERVFYQKVKDIYCTSVDYDPKSETTQKFFAVVQNKLHWAIHKHTAPELICERAKAENANMGLTNWKRDKIRIDDIVIAKNYLAPNELAQLNLLVEQYLAFAELQAFMRKPMHMKDWEKKLNDFLTINEREILEDAGKISRKLAEELARKEYDKYIYHLKEIDIIESYKELENELKSLK